MPYALLYLLTIPAANWLIAHWGTVCVPDGPCLIPVGFGFMAPSGVLMVGFALVLRDAVQLSLGRAWSVAAIIGGSALSAFVAPPTLIIASAAAFLLSELADFAVFTPLQRRQLTAAVLLGALIGAFVDSAVFLHLAFGSLDYLPGQVLGKMWAAMAATPLIWARRALA